QESNLGKDDKGVIWGRGGLAFQWLTNANNLFFKGALGLETSVVGTDAVHQFQLWTQPTYGHALPDGFHHEAAFGVSTAQAGKGTPLLVRRIDPVTGPVVARIYTLIAHGTRPVHNLTRRTLLGLLGRGHPTVREEVLAADQRLGVALDAAQAEG